MNHAVGIDFEMPEGEYHAHPAFSHSGAKTILRTPALYKWERENGRPNKKPYDVGHAVHSAILGVGQEIVEVKADDWRTKAAQSARKTAYAAGKVPLLSADVRQVLDMVKAFWRHPLSQLIDRRHGNPEVSAFWLDEATGIDLRCRYDWLPDVVDDRLVIVDLKTAAKADAWSFSKAVHDYGYAGQDAWYRSGARALGLHPDPRFVFLVIETSPPYLVAGYELDALAKAKGALDNRLAIDLYAECLSTDTWPGYSEDVQHLSLPRYATYDVDPEEDE